MGAVISEEEIICFELVMIFKDLCDQKQSYSSENNVMVQCYSKAIYVGGKLQRWAWLRFYKCYYIHLFQCILSYALFLCIMFYALYVQI